MDITIKTKTGGHERDITITYLSRIPAAAEVPAGLVVVHNSVRPTRRLGSRGFRAWLQERRPELVRCDCPWAPEAGPHYRVERHR